MKQAVRLLMTGAIVTGLAVVACGKTNFVAGGATGAGTGADWPNAYTTLSQALVNATTGDSIWVAQGTYYPGANRTDSFKMVTNVSVYGGFTTQMVSFAERNPTSYPVILDGDVDKDGTSANNAYHVIAGAAGSTLDGVTVRNGYANGSSPNERGAGIYHTNGVFTLKDCVVAANITTNMGGGLYGGPNANVQFQQCAFDGNIATNTAGSTAGAVYMDGCTGTLVTCAFRSNYAVFRGGALYLNGGAKPAFESCTFTSNSVGTQSSNGGGAIYAWGTGNRPVFRNCQFVQNFSPLTGSGGALAIRTDALLEDCMVVSNKSGSGGAIQVPASAAVTLKGCLFTGNFANTGGGLNVSGNAVLSNCTFTTCWGDNYAGAIYASAGTLSVDDSRFSGNLGKGTSSTPTLGGGGAVVLRTASKAVFRNCLFSGNHANTQAGCLSVEGLSAAALTNCLFAGNWATAVSTNGANGGALYLVGTGAVTAVNCTFANNRSGFKGGAVFCDASTSLFSNCILWTNVSGAGREAFVTNNGLVAFQYTDVRGGWDGSGVVNNGGAVSNGGGNRDVDPLYAPALTGTWTATGSYNSLSGQTVLTDANATWTPGALVARFVNPNPTDADAGCGQQQYYIVTNAATTITVWGNASWGGTGETYRIYDYHLQSRTGRWTPLGRVRDGAASPCIDAGDPATVVVLEPRPNGGLVNLGCFGNTLQASMSAVGGTMIVIR